MAKSADAFQEKFIKANCASGIALSKENTRICGKNKHTNNAFGNIPIDGVKYPDATYKWKIQPEGIDMFGGSYIGGMMVGISTNRALKNKDFKKNKNIPFYGYWSDGSIRSETKYTATSSEYEGFDMIIIKVDIKAKTITFFKNGTVAHSIQNIDVSKKYWLIISLKDCAAKLEKFEFNQGNVEEKKQDIKPMINAKKKQSDKSGINTAKLVEDLQKELLNKIQEIDQLTQRNKDITQQSEQLKIKSVKLEKKIETLSSQNESLQKELKQEKVGKQQQKQDLKKSKEEIAELQSETVKLKSDLEKISHQKQLLVKQVNELEKTNESLLKREEEEKKDKDDEAKGLKNDLISLGDKMNEFNTNYDENRLSMIYDKDPDSLFIEEDINNTQLIFKSFSKHLQDIKNYVLSVTKPDVNQYKLWDLKTTMIWIKSLDNGYFIKYCHVLRAGFESDGVVAEELPNIGQTDLREQPFNIKKLMDRKKLAQHFKSLELAQIPNENEGGQTAYI